MHINSVNTFYV